MFVFPCISDFYNLRTDVNHNLLILCWSLICAVFHLDRGCCWCWHWWENAIQWVFWVLWSWIQPSYCSKQHGKSKSKELPRLIKVFLLISFFVHFFVILYQISFLVWSGKGCLKIFQNYSMFLVSSFKKDHLTQNFLRRLFSFKCWELLSCYMQILVSFDAMLQIIHDWKHHLGF